MGDVVVRNQGFDLDLLIEKAKELDLDKIEKFLQLKNSEEARRRKDDYDLNFALMQKDYVAVKRDKAAKDGQTILYRYCPLENILKVYQPIITNHGFSYRWAEEAIKEGYKRVWCIVSGYGHEERSYIDIPILQGSKFANSIQQVGASSTYGKRYSFCNAFGIIIEDEDDDAKAKERGRERNADTALKPILEYAIEEKKNDILDRWDHEDINGKPALYKIIRGEVFIDLISPFAQARVTYYQGKWTACKTPADYIAVLSEAANEARK